MQEFQANEETARTFATLALYCGDHFKSKAMRACASVPDMRSAVESMDAAMEAMERASGFSEGGSTFTDAFASTLDTP
eukprot:8023692-Pyramimonas_sp.AAC.1